MLQKGKQGLGPHQESREASFSTVSTVGSKSRALLSRPKSSAMRSAPYMSPYLLITYTLHREDSSDRERSACLRDSGASEKNSDATVCGFYTQDLHHKVHHLDRHTSTDTDCTDSLSA